MEERILRMLRRTEGYLSGEAICRELGVSRQTVWNIVEKLRVQGYQIDSAPRRGYRLQSGPRQVVREAVLSYLPEDFPWRDRVTVLPEADSTNTQLKVLAAGGAPEGTVLIARRQTGGRGRMGRDFLSPEGMGVYLSVLLRPECPAGELMHLTCAVAVAMCDAVQDAAGFRPGIKWTNDLVAGGKKLAGILTELGLEAESGAVRYAVAGIGINCRQRAEDFPPELRQRAGSLEMIAHREVDQNRLAAAMISRLQEMAGALQAKKAVTMARYRRDCVTLGREVTFSWEGKVLEGRAEDVDENGALIVALPEGGTVKVASGEVSVRAKNGYL